VGGRHQRLDLAKSLAADPRSVIEKAIVLWAPTSAFQPA